MPAFVPKANTKEEARHCLRKIFKWLASGKALGSNRYSRRDVVAGTVGLIRRFPDLAKEETYHPVLFGGPNAAGDPRIKGDNPRTPLFLLALFGATLEQVQEIYELHPKAMQAKGRELVFLVAELFYAKWAQRVYCHDEFTLVERLDVLAFLAEKYPHLLAVPLGLAPEQYSSRSRYSSFPPGTTHECCAAHLVLLHLLRETSHHISDHRDQMSYEEVSNGLYFNNLFQHVEPYSPEYEAIEAQCDAELARLQAVWKREEQEFQQQTVHPFAALIETMVRNCPPAGCDPLLLKLVLRCDLGSTVLCDRLVDIVVERCRSKEFRMDQAVDRLLHKFYPSHDLPTRYGRAVAKLTLANGLRTLVLEPLPHREVEFLYALLRENPALVDNFKRKDFD